MQRKDPITMRPLFYPRHRRRQRGEHKYSDVGLKIKDILCFNYCQIFADSEAEIKANWHAGRDHVSAGYHSLHAINLCQRLREAPLGIS